MLKNRYLIELPGKEFRSVGGLNLGTSAGMVTRVFQRMNAWMVLALKTLETEFPSFEALYCFGMFSLKPCLSQEAVSECSRKLCSVFPDMDANKLLAEFTKFKHFAQRNRTLTWIGFLLTNFFLIPTHALVFVK